MPTFGDGVYQFGGVPTLSGGLPIVAGNVYWVSSVLGSSANDGTRERPFNTLARALDFSTVNDCIVLMPAHAETLNSTLVFNIDQAGTIVWGLGEYDYRPLYTVSGSGNHAIIAAANCRVHNIRFLAGSTSIAYGMYISAKGARITNCMFEEPAAASSANFDEGLITGATANEADGLSVENCVFYQISGASSAGIVIDGNHNDIRILNNRFLGHWTSGGSPIYSASTVAMYNIEVGWNMISNSQSTDTNQQYGIFFDTVTGMGWVHNNYVICESSAVGPADGIVVNATCTIATVNNYISGESGESGLLAPAVYAS